MSFDRKKWAKQYRNNHHERLKELQREWRKNNTKKIKEYNRLYYQNHEEEAKESKVRWRKKNLSKVNERQKQWGKNNPEKLKEIQQKSYQKHREERLKERRQHYKELSLKDREKELERLKQWKKNNPEKAKEHQKRYRENHCKEIKQRRKEKVQYVQNYKLSKGCKFCGYNENPRFLGFHHPDDNKEFKVSYATYRMSLEKIKKEMDKCILLCNSCHIKLHWKLKREEKKELDKNKKKV